MFIFVFSGLYSNIAQDDHHNTVRLLQAAY